MGVLHHHHHHQRLLLLSTTSRSRRISTHLLIQVRSLSLSSLILFPNDSSTSNNNNISCSSCRSSRSTNQPTTTSSSSISLSSLVRPVTTTKTRNKLYTTESNLIGITTTQPIIVTLQCGHTKNYPTQFQQQHYRTMSTNPSDSDANNNNYNNDNKNETQDEESSSDTNGCVVVYTSPLGNVVQRLRTVSLITGIIGTIGLPIIVAIKGVDVNTGLIGMGMAFVTCTVGSTIAVHTVFSPYVYRIEQIPVRVCNNNNNNKITITNTTTNTTMNPTTTCSDDTNNNNTDDLTNTTTIVAKKKDILYKAITKTLFLQQREIVFDPVKDMKPYTGWLPLCNFVIDKNNTTTATTGSTSKVIPLYVHTEFVQDITIRNQLDSYKPKTDDDTKFNKDNPDDFL